MANFKVSIGGVDDLNLLVRHRLAMWKEILSGMDERIDSSEGTTADWLRRKLLNDTLIPFIARVPAGHVAGSGCILVREDQPRPTTRMIQNPYLMSMYTEEAFRRQGVATAIVGAAINWCRERGYDTVTLHASGKGRPIYEKFGFVQTNEMRLTL